MSILALPTSPIVRQQIDTLRALAPDERIDTDPDAAVAADVEAILAFRLPPLATRFPNLRFVASTGAGVDDLLAELDLPAQIPVVRPVDPLQGLRMAQYLALAVLRVVRDLPALEAQQREARWERRPPVPESAWPIGVMGHGELAAPAVRTLAALGFPVAVWTRRARALPGIEAFAGADALPAFLARTRILVCALPLTAATRGLLDAARFRQLAPGAHVINVSRGALLVDADLVAALDDGTLAGATLDVFATEPLPAASPLWRHARILCTPHVAAFPDPATAATQFLDNLRRARAGEPLLRRVDRARGY